MSGRPKLLDLFCGAGGAARGYVDAGFEVVGVDSSPMPRYPYEFVQADALEYLDAHWRDFDVIHASPPCHGHSVLNVVNQIEYGTEWLLAETIDRLNATGLPFIVENVPAPTTRQQMPNRIQLCGSEFDLRTTLEPYGEVWLRRHRWFESNVFLFRAGGCRCAGKLTVGVYGHGAGGSGQRVRGKGVAKASREVMGIDWMTRDELDEAIPPAYTQFIGEQLIEMLADTLDDSIGCWSRTQALLPCGCVDKRHDEDGNEIPRWELDLLHKQWCPNEVTRETTGGAA